MVDESIVRASENFTFTLQAIAAQVNRPLIDIMRKPTFCICENKDNREVGQRLCFRYTDSTIPLLSKSKISSLWLYSAPVQLSLCRTCLQTTLLVSPRCGSISVTKRFIRRIGIKRTKVTSKKMTVPPKYSVTGSLSVNGSLNEFMKSNSSIIIAVRSRESPTVE